MAKVLYNNKLQQWRGCLDPFQDSDILDNWSLFGSRVINETLNITAYEFSSCFLDLCNDPLKCYMCTGGANTTCSPKDVGLRDCLLTQRYCAVKIDTF